MDKKITAGFVACKHSDCTRTARFLVANIGRNDDYYVYPSCEECYRKELMRGAEMRIITTERPRRLWMNDIPLPLGSINKDTCWVSNLLSSLKNIAVN